MSLIPSLDVSICHSLPVSLSSSSLGNLLSNPSVSSLLSSSSSSTSSSSSLSDRVSLEPKLVRPGQLQFERLSQILEPLEMDDEEIIFLEETLQRTFSFNSNKFIPLPNAMYLFMEATEVRLYVKMEKRGASGGLKKCYNAMQVILSPHKFPESDSVILLERFKDDSKSKRNFELGVKFLQELQGCKNIASLIDSDVEAGLMFLELCDGGSLLSFLQVNKSIVNFKNSPLIFYSLFMDLLKGLEQLGAKRIVHTDLNPENLVIKSIGESEYELKIIDLDNARSLEQETYRSAICESSSPMFVTRVLDHRCIDSSHLFVMNAQEKIRCDVWAAGCIFYYMMFEQNPRWSEPLEQLGSMINLYKLLKVAKEKVKLESEVKEEESKCEAENVSAMKKGKSTKKSFKLFTDLVSIEDLSNLQKRIDSLPAECLVFWGPREARIDHFLEGELREIDRIVSNLHCFFNQDFSIETMKMREEACLACSSIILKNIIALKGKLDEAWTALFSKEYPDDPIKNFICHKMLTPDAQKSKIGSELVNEFEELIDGIALIEIRDDDVVEEVSDEEVNELDEVAADSVEITDEDDVEEEGLDRVDETVDEVAGEAVI